MLCTRVSHLTFHLSYLALGWISACYAGYHLHRPVGLNLIQDILFPFCWLIIMFFITLGCLSKEKNYLAKQLSNCFPTEKLFQNTLARVTFLLRETFDLSFSTSDWTVAGSIFADDDSNDREKTKMMDNLVYIVSLLLLFCFFVMQGLWFFSFSNSLQCWIPA